ncbi:MAG: chloride channel protein [Acidobacteriota bacterium]
MSSPGSPRLSRSRFQHLAPFQRLVRRLFFTAGEGDIGAGACNPRKCLLLAPAVGVVTGLAITGLVVVLLNHLWPLVLSTYLDHHWAILPGLVLGSVVAGLIMQKLTPDPNEHSTEEIVRAYHEHGGRIDLHCFFPKIAAAIATVGSGGSAALEGPSIYGGGAIGSGLWNRLRRFPLNDRERRIMLICGAAAGMSAVFRAPLTGIVFALEMPFLDDLAYEALAPSLIASVVAFVTLSAFLGAKPLFGFHSAGSYTRRDIYWSALLGLLIGVLALLFVVAFRRVRSFAIRARMPHWLKMGIGGLLTGLCGLAFLWLYPGRLTPLGPNYEAVGMILNQHHTTAELLSFAALKLGATIATLGTGGVSAMFVPLFLTGGTLGTAFAQSLVHSANPGLYAAVGMAAFLSAGYKTPLAAVVFVAEATGGHAFIVPAIIAAAVAYAVSGDASASSEQRSREEPLASSGSVESSDGSALPS